MRIGIAADHGGFLLKEQLVARLKSAGHEVVDFGTDSDQSVDYPLFRIPRSVQFSHTSGHTMKTFRSYHAFRIAASPCI